MTREEIVFVPVDARDRPFRIRRENFASSLELVGARGERPWLRVHDSRRYAFDLRFSSTESLRSFVEVVRKWAKPKSAGNHLALPGNLGENLPCTNHRAAPILEPGGAEFSVDPTTCLDSAPKVAFVTVGDLPEPVRSGLLESDPTSPALSEDTIMLLYVPPFDHEGHRVVTLEGISCSPDTCLDKVGRPTQEKCEVPPRSRCASRIVLPNQKEIDLSATEIPAGGGMGEVPIAGVVVVASEIRIKGTVRTGGSNLVLAAQELVGVGTDPGIDVSPERGPISQTAAAGSRLVVVAEKVGGAPLFLRSNGAPGAFPESAGIHWDCEDYTHDGSFGNPLGYGNPTCFPCSTSATQNPGEGAHPSFGVFKGNGWLRCFTKSDMSNPASTYYYYEYPPGGSLPDSFLVRAPDGQAGGGPGRVRAWVKTGLELCGIGTGGGKGSRGLGGYRVYVSNSACCLGPYVDPACCGQDIPEGKSYTTISGSYQKATLFTGSSAELFIALATIADELIVPDEMLFMGDRAYRKLDRIGARTQYELARAALGSSDWMYPCSLQHLVRAARSRISSRLAQLDANLDFRGRAVDWVPYDSPAHLTQRVESRLENVTLTAMDLKLNALLAFASTTQQAIIAENIGKSDGDLAKSEMQVHDLLIAEKAGRLEELQAWASLYQDQITTTVKAITAFYEQHESEDTLGVLSGLVELGTTIATFGEDVVDVVKDTTFANLTEATKDGNSLFQGIRKTIGLLESPSDPICGQDYKCRQLTQELKFALQRLTAANLAVKAEFYALQAETASLKEFEARRDLSKDILRIEQNNTTMVEVDKLVRAQKYLCEYGALLADDAAGSLHELKRASALWDVPNPQANESVYSGDGGRYDYGFVKLFDPSCTQYSGCSLWKDYDDFMDARPGHQPPNQATIYLGKDDASVANALAMELRSGASTPGRVELKLGTVGSDGKRWLGTSTTQDMQFSLTDKWAVQVLDVRVHAYDSAMKSVRSTFPFRLSRPLSDKLRNDLFTGSSLSFTMQALQTLDLDGGQLRTVPTFDTVTGFSFRILDFNQPDSVVLHPESLEKVWSLWVPICAAGGSPGSECASMDEVNTIERLQIEVAIRYKH